jgi:hypothetical protein
MHHDALPRVRRKREVWGEIMNIFGIFNEEGLVEGQFDSKEEALAAVDDRYHPEDWFDVAECCPDHPEERKEGCRECPGDEDDDV